MPTATAASSLLKQDSIAPDEVLEAAESQWLFTEEELNRTPSIVHGIPPDKERENRSKGVNFILQLGIMLKLPQITLATASIYLHRFYMRKPMEVPRETGYHYYSMGATCLFLAIKVEENCRRLRELVIASVRVAQKNPHKEVDVEVDKEYWRWRDIIMRYEDILLEAICFDLRLEPPYKTLYDILLKYGEENNKKLRNSAWAFISDSYLTTLCLLFPTKTIAASALYAAARHTGVAFPDDHRGRPWWETVGVDIEDIGRACDHLAKMYRSAQMKGSREDGLYETTGHSDDGLDKTRLISDQSTPTGQFDGASRSSPNLAPSGKASYESSNGITKRANGSDDEASRKRHKVDDNIGRSQPDDNDAFHGKCSEKLPSRAVSQAETSVIKSKASTIDSSQSQTQTTIDVKLTDIGAPTGQQPDDGSEEGELDTS